MIKEIHTNPFHVLATVNEAGYEWLKDDDGRLRLVPARIPGLGSSVREPYPGLFRDFAQLRTTSDAIRDFANQYGDLFSRYSLEQTAARKDGTIATGASLGTWAKEIGDMQTLVELWDQIQYCQTSAIKKIIRWTNKSVGYVVKTPRRTSSVTLAHADIPGSGFSRFERKDVLLPAKCALQMEINKRIAEHPTVPRLSWTPDTPNRNQRLVFTPPNLLGAMWLQFAQAVTGEFELYACEWCGNFFQRGPGGRRADATTCSDACRQQKSRNNRRK